MMKKIFLLISFFLLPLIGWGQSEIIQTQAKVYSVFLYNFTKYTNWPDSFQPEKFTIGFYGNDQYLPFLKQMAKQKKTINDKPIEILNFDSLSTIKPCHILFLPGVNKKEVKTISNNLSNQPTLVVTNHLDILKAESCINFVSTKEKMRFELNQKAIRERGLMVADNLKKLAIVK